MARPKAFDREKAQLQALRLFWRKGYTATSIEDLTAALSLSRSSLYDTFGDKRTLFLDALRLYSARVIGGITQTLHDAPSPLDGIRKIFDDLVAGAGGETGEMGCFMVNSIAELAPHDPDVTQIAAEYGDAIQRLVAEALSRAGYDQPEALAAFLYNAIQGLRIVIKAGMSRAQAASIAAITLASLE